MSGGDGAHDELVLIVEDDPSIAELVQFVLEDEFGIHAVVAEDGERGLELARQLRPPLVLLDINLPKLSGLDVARRLKADPKTRALPLVAMTATSEADARKAGCSDHLAKPFELDDLTNMVGKYLGFAATVHQAMGPASATNRATAQEPRSTAKQTYLTSRAPSKQSARLAQISKVSKGLQRRAA